MVMTVQTVLDSPSLQAGRPEVVAGASGLDRTVRWVHVSDIREIAGILSGEEVVLSTGLSIGESDTEARSYLRDVIDAGASALVVELSVRLPHLPAVMLAAAEKASFPVIVLHSRIRFVTVTEQIHRDIVAAQYEELRRAQSVHEAFTALSLEGASAHEIVRTAATIAGTSVVLEDLNRHVLAHVGVQESDADLLRDWRRRSRSVAVQSETARTSGAGWLTTPVGLQDQVWGRLVIPDPGADGRFEMLLERAAQALQIGRMVERDRLGVEFQAQSGFLQDLVRGGVGSEADARARVQALGLEAGRSFVPLVVHRPTGSADPVHAQRQGRQLVEAISHAVKAAKCSALVGMIDSDAAGVVLAVPTGKDEEATVRRLAESVHTELTRDAAQVAPSIGVEDGTKTLLACGPGLRRAQQVASVAHASHGAAKAFYRHADVRLLGLMALLREDPRVQSFAESELQALLAHDARHNDGMLELLRTFLDCGGNKSTLAREVGRSRPAVYKQLARLERLLGVPLDDAASRTSLSVALLAHDQSLARTVYQS